MSTPPRDDAHDCPVLRGLGRALEAPCAVQPCADILVGLAESWCAHPAEAAPAARRFSTTAAAGIAALLEGLRNTLCAYDQLLGPHWGPALDLLDLAADLFRTQYRTPAGDMACDDAVMSGLAALLRTVAQRLRCASMAESETEERPGRAG
jgi:hypothetical protein